MGIHYHARAENYIYDSIILLHSNNRVGTSTIELLYDALYAAGMVHWTMHCYGVLNELYDELASCSSHCTIATLSSFLFNGRMVTS
jgi:hypothetical protein